MIADAANGNPARATWFCGGAGDMVFDPNPTLPNIDTRSSSGLLDVPERRFAAAGVDASTAVAAIPEGCCSSDVGSSKLSRFSAC